MKAQRAAATGAGAGATPTSPRTEGQPGPVPGAAKASLGVEEGSGGLEGKVLPAPAEGELESLMARAEASKAKKGARRQPGTAAAGPPEGQPGLGPGVAKASLGVEAGPASLEGKVLPAPAQGELESLMARAEASKAKQGARRAPGGQAQAPQRLVGGDAGSLRQAAPFVPEGTRAGAPGEGWDATQIDAMQQAEAEWKQRLAAKQAEERMANALAEDAARFVIGPDLVSQKGVPKSMEAAVVQSLLASFSVMQQGCARLRIDVDTTGGDETYTTLKNSVPFARVFCKALRANRFGRVRLVFPDLGAAALARRDWADEDGLEVSAFGRSVPEVEEDDDAVVCIAPASSELPDLRKLAERAEALGLPLILINPSVKSPGGENLGALGAYAIGLSEFLQTFEYAYYLRTLDWGVILRSFPSAFKVYQEGVSARGKKKYELLEEVRSVPSGVTLEEIYLRANPEAAQEGLQSISTGLRRFIDSYSKG